MANLADWLCQVWAGRIFDRAPRSPQPPTISRDVEIINRIAKEVDELGIADDRAKIMQLVAKRYDEWKNSDPTRSTP